MEALRQICPIAGLYTLVMGQFNVHMTVSSPGGESSREINALVDTGAKYTLLLGELQRELNLPTLWENQFEMADGRVITMPVGEARVSLDGIGGPTYVIFGPEGCEPLLGAMTLQELALVIDMPNERLRRETGPVHL